MAEIRENGKHSVFTKLRFDEVLYTQLLCNLITRCDSFQRMILELLTDDCCNSNNVASSQIVTEKWLNAHARADIVIDSKDLLMIVEVKLSEFCDRTEDQVWKYADYLRSDPSKRNKVLAYLIPSRWIHRTQTEKDLEAIMKEGATGQRAAIKTCMVTWEQVCLKIQSPFRQPCDPLVQEFGVLLKPRFGSVSFTDEEIKFMYGKDFLEAFSRVRKVEKIVDELKVRCETKFREKNKGVAAKENQFEVWRENSLEDTYGIYFVKGKDVPDGAAKELLWIGIRDVTAGRLSFGIETAWETKTTGLLVALDASHAIRPELSPDGYALRVVSEEVFSDRILPADAIWKMIEPVLETVVNISRREEHPCEAYPSQVQH